MSHSALRDHDATATTINGNSTLTFAQSKMAYATEDATEIQGVYIDKTPARRLTLYWVPEGLGNARKLAVGVAFTMQTIILVVHGTTSPGPLPNTLFFAREPMFPKERQRPLRRLRLSAILESKPANSRPALRPPSPWAISAASLSKR